MQTLASYRLAFALLAPAALMTTPARAETFVDAMSNPAMAGAPPPAAPKLAELAGGAVTRVAVAPAPRPSQANLEDVGGLLESAEAALHHHRIGAAAAALAEAEATLRTVHAEGRSDLGAPLGDIAHARAALQHGDRHAAERATAAARHQVMHAS